MSASYCLSHLKIRQRGVAAIQMVLIVGMALSVAAMGAMHYIGSTQDVSQSTHALTQAQMKARNGVDAFRQYLYQVSGTSQVPTAGSAIALSGLNGISGTVTQVQANTSGCPSGTQVTANLTGTSGGANSTVQSVYCVGSAPSSTVTLPNLITINGNLQLTGSVQANGGTTGSTSFLVNGNISSSGSIGGFNLLYATGTITLNGGASANTISAQGDVNINATGNYVTVNSMQNVTLSSRVSVVTVNSNGLTNLKTSSSATTVNAIGGVTLGEWAKATTVNTDVDVQSGGGQISTLNAQGSFTETNDGSVSSGAVGGSVDLPPYP
ncbi:hypothetical protein PI87_27470, partial [Ralstonia sp. A12]|uniref:hypothetical protein n=1 Tax=Ralstonia sp. A12 TaxID=1217052 RepID=UPI00057445BF